MARFEKNNGRFIDTKFILQRHYNDRFSKPKN